MMDESLAKHPKSNGGGRVGLQGFKLKLFEEITADLLVSCKPTYSKLPALPDNQTRELLSSSIQANPIFKEKIEVEVHLPSEQGVPPPEWPFSAMPLDAGVRLTKNKTSRKTGKLPGMRAVKKEWQLKSLIQCVLAMLPSSAFGIPDGTEEKKIRIVDFAGGTGHLSLPLAVLLPKCEIVLVDLKKSSLDLALQKAEELASPIKEVEDVNEELNEVLNEEVPSPVIVQKKRKFRKKRRKVKSASNSAPSTRAAVTIHENELRQSKHVTNLYTYHGSISTYAEEQGEFDIGLGLHACGEATDIVLRACGEVKANFIVSPCCVGKLSQTKRNPYIYRATAGNEPTISYPQSSTFCQIIPSSSKFDVLAKSADYSNIQDMRTSRNAIRRTAKALLEMDRLLYMKETFGYDEIALARMDPWEATPKNDILIGTMRTGVGSPFRKSQDNDNTKPDPCIASNKDIDMAMHLLIAPAPEDVMNESNICMDWTKDENDEIESELKKFIESSNTTYKFPKGMGKRKRRLVHAIATRLSLAHWSEGKKNSDKIVVVAKE